MTRYEEAEVYELYMNGRGLDPLIVHVTVREGRRDMQQVYGYGEANGMHMARDKL